MIIVSIGCAIAAASMQPASYAAEKDQYTMYLAVELSAPRETLAQTFRRTVLPLIEQHDGVVINTYHAERSLLGEFPGNLIAFVAWPHKAHAFASGRKLIYADRDSEVLDLVQMVLGHPTELPQGQQYDLQAKSGRVDKRTFLFSAVPLARGRTFADCLRQMIDMIRIGNRYDGEPIGVYSTVRTMEGRFAPAVFGISVWPSRKHLDSFMRLLKRPRYGMRVFNRTAHDLAPGDAFMVEVSPINAPD